MIQSLTRIEMISVEPQALASFYQVAFGCVTFGTASSNVEMRLGSQIVRLIRAEPPGRPYPPDVAGWNTLFQHIAIVVTDMAQAYAHLSAIPGWTPISTSGPQILPATSGGVSAFKFRDPEGHPLELIAFPPGAVPPRWQTTAPELFLGIDHSAISVSNTATSIAFYESLGLHRSGGSLNVGDEQAKLDGVPDAVVEVTALKPAQPTPHVELLCYRGHFVRRTTPHDPNDIAATRLVLSIESRAALDALCTCHPDALISGSVLRESDICRAMLKDPDGHLICLEALA